MNSNILVTGFICTTTEEMDVESRTSLKKRPLEGAIEPEPKRQRVCNSIVNERLIRCLSKVPQEELFTFAHAAYTRGDYNDFEDVVLAVFLRFHGQYSIEQCRMLLMP